MPVACKPVLGYCVSGRAGAPHPPDLGPSALRCSSPPTWRYSPALAVSPIAGLAALPVAVFELSFGIYLVVKGFRTSSPLMARPSADVRVPAPRSGGAKIVGQEAGAS